MNVYVESNFVLEYALQQDELDACAEVIRLASKSRVRLLVPAFSLAEPNQVIAGKAKVRARLGAELSSHLAELGRSKPHRHVPATFSSLTGVLQESAEFESDGLRRAVATMLQVAEIIPLDAEILVSTSTIGGQYQLSAQDSIVLASILSHLERAKPSESCFLNRNYKDFDDPGIRQRLESFKCKFFTRFATGLEYVVSRVE